MAQTLQNPVKDASHRCDAALKMEKFWKIVQDIKAGTHRIREEKLEYLPRFEAEEQRDYEARVKMTFVDDYYAQTLHDHVGLVFASPPQLGEKIPDALTPLLENVDGEGTHWEVFAQRVFTTALDDGHALIVTDYPVVQATRTMRQAKDAKQRPFLALYSARDVLSWRVATVGGVRVLTQIVLKEEFENDSGSYAVETIGQYRVFTQAVERDAFGTATGLGAITWQLFRDAPTDAPSVAANESQLILVASGTIDGPETLPVRIIYGGERLRTLETRPALLPLAYASVEHTQVSSDYAQVMHKCNVPTPVFTGRGRARAGATTKMGQGIDLPAGATASMLEPKGTALAATRARLQDILARMARSGAFVSETGVQMTATEASLYAKQRNAKLMSAARSLQDALEGALCDMAAFLDVDDSGCEVKINTDFNTGVDPKSLDVYLRMYQANALPLWALLEIAKTGTFPDDFDVNEAALELTAQAMADAEKTAQLAAEANAALLQRGAKKATAQPPTDALDPAAAGAGGDTSTAETVPAGEAGKDG